MRADDEPITLKTKVCRPVSRFPSVMIERRDPFWNRLTHKFHVFGENPRHSSESEQIRVLLERQKNRFSLIFEQRFENMSSRPIMTEEVSKS